MASQSSQTSNFFPPQASEPSEPQPSGSKVAQNIMFYENLAISCNLEVGPLFESPQSTPRGTNAQVPPTGPMKEPSLEVELEEEMGGESTGDQATAIQPSLETFMSQPVGLSLPAWSYPRGRDTKACPRQVARD